MRRRAAGAALLITPLLAGCVYYNTMWSAERFSRQARRAEARGDDGGARVAWTQAAAKAESVHVRHPGSKWADDAWVLHAEGAARGGSCARARPVIGSALVEAGSDGLRERAALVAAECALSLGHPAEASPYLEIALASRDAGRRSRARYLSGRVAEARGDLAAAMSWYARSEERAAGPSRVRALVMADSIGAALALIDTVARGRFVEAEWTALLGAVAARAGTAVSSEALDRLLGNARITAAERGRLLLADANRCYAAGRFDSAVDRYDAVIRTGADGPEVRLAQVRLVRARAASAAGREDIARLQEELEQRTRGAASAAPEALALAGLLQTVVPEPPSDTAMFRAAELARDSLRASDWAGALFLDYADRYPASLFAPKALIAALPLLPARADSLRRVLDERYGDSPYVLALRGENSPAYAGLEDSLARALGFRVTPMLARAGDRLRAPGTGPRGPWWDDEPRPAGRVAVADTAARASDDDVLQQRARPADRRRQPTSPARPDP